MKEVNQKKPKAQIELVGYFFYWPTVNGVRLTTIPYNGTLSPRGAELSARDEIRNELRKRKYGIDYEVAEEIARKARVVNR